jgi:hypothetical protein
MILGWSESERSSDIDCFWPVGTIQDAHQLRASTGCSTCNPAPRPVPVGRKSSGTNVRGGAAETRTVDGPGARLSFTQATMPAASCQRRSPPTARRPAHAARPDNEPVHQWIDFEASTTRMKSSSNVRTSLICTASRCHRDGDGHPCRARCHSLRRTREHEPVLESVIARRHRGTCCEQLHDLDDSARIGVARTPRKKVRPPALRVSVAARQARSTSS